MSVSVCLGQVILSLSVERSRAVRVQIWLASSTGMPFAEVTAEERVGGGERGRDGGRQQLEGHSPAAGFMPDWWGTRVALTLSQKTKQVFALLLLSLQGHFYNYI